LIILGNEITDLHPAVRNNRKDALHGYAIKFPITMLPVGSCGTWRLNPLRVLCIASFDPLFDSLLVEGVNTPPGRSLVYLKCGHDLSSWKIV
jgi:hypothetical protein